MGDLRGQLRECLRGRVCWMGLGNVEFGDDGFGVRLAEALLEGGAPAAMASTERRVPSSPGIGGRGAPPTAPPPGGWRSVATEGGGHGGPPSVATEGGGHGSPPSTMNVVIAGTAPERFIGRAAGAGCDHLVFLDAVEFGGPPGSAVFMGAPEIAARFPQVSTHKMALGLLARWAAANGIADVWLLGAQPESLRPSRDLTPTMQATLRILYDLIRGLEVPPVRRVAEAKA